jgi:hypothetical protein
MEIIEEIKNTRVNIDEIFTFCRELKPSREIALAITSFELSKMWLGKVLKQAGNPNPYPESRNPENEKIEKTADTSGPERPPEFYEFNQIQRVKWLRAQIEKVEEKIDNLSDFCFSLTPNVVNHFDKPVKTMRRSFFASYDKCVEAGMWLGMELGRINNEQGTINK